MTERNMWYYSAKMSCLMRLKIRLLLKHTQTLVARVYACKVKCPDNYERERTRNITHTSYYHIPSEMHIHII